MEKVDQVIAQERERAAKTKASYRGLKSLEGLDETWMQGLPQKLKPRIED